VDIGEERGEGWVTWRSCLTLSFVSSTPANRRGSEGLAALAEALQPQVNPDGRLAHHPSLNVESVLGTCDGASVFTLCVHVLHPFPLHLELDVVGVSAMWMNGGCFIYGVNSCDGQAIGEETAS
jgi:hypothetical protein